MRNSIGANRVAQRRGYVRLARHLVEALRSPFARNDLIAQGGVLASPPRGLASRRLGHSECWGFWGVAIRILGVPGWVTSGFERFASRVDRRAARPQPRLCYGCFLPDLTGFTGSRTRTGPCGQRSTRAHKVPVGGVRFNRQAAPARGSNLASIEG